MSKKNQISKTKNIILAAGGTGGHIFPAEALASELIKNKHKVTLITDNRYKKYSHAPDSMQVKSIKMRSSRGGLVAKLHSIISICLAILKTRKILKKQKPDVVVGFGGYPSFPTVVAAISLGIKVIIHEQNAVLGRVNRMLAPYSKVIATSFAKVSGIKNADTAKVVFTGNPVRPAIVALKDFPYPEIKDSESLHLLVTGGSQGAKIFSEIVPDAVLRLPKKLRSRIRIDQQCRAEDLDRVKKIYEDAGVNADLASFFDDMPSRLASAHLVLARAGASTIAELMVAGRPAILVPYMHAMDDHQTENALVAEGVGAVSVIRQQEFTPEVLSNQIKIFMEDADKLKQMAVNAFDVGCPDAEKKLAEIVLKD